MKRYVNYYVVYVEVDPGDVGRVQNLLEVEDNAGVMLQTLRAKGLSTIEYGVTPYKLSTILAMLGDLMKEGVVKRMLVKQYEKWIDEYREPV